MNKMHIANRLKLDLSREHLKNVEFIKCDDPNNFNVNDGYIVVFKEPIYLSEGVRLSPLYPELGSDEFGNVYRRRNLEKIDTRRTAKDCNYRSIGLGDRDVKAHRVIASCWCQNDDPVNNFVVNHKDGRKRNNYYKNLEWVSHKGNINHAFDNKLIETEKRCLVKNLITGQVTCHESVTSAAEFMGVTQSTVTVALSNRRAHNRTIKNRYEVKYESDQTTWKFNKDTEIPVRHNYVFEVCFPDGEKRVYYNAYEMYKELTGRTGCLTVKAIVKSIERYISGVVINVTKKTSIKTIQIKNITTGEIIEETSLKAAERLLKRSYTYIINVLSQGRTASDGIYAFREKSDDDWVFEEVPNKDKVKVRVTNLLNGISMIFTSILAIHKETGISKPCVRSCVANDRIFKNFKFEKLE